MGLSLNRCGFLSVGDVATGNQLEPESLFTLVLDYG